MRRVLPLSLMVAGLCSSALCHSQDRFAYAITDKTKDGAAWTALRKLDLTTGKYSDVLLDGTNNQLTVFDANTRKPLTLQKDARYGDAINQPFGTGVAAAAYDKRHNRLYFTPMFVDQLRYIDLDNMKVYYVNDKAITGAGNMTGDEGKIMTRMVIMPDGYGYAISNDGSVFVKFSTTKKNEIQQIGSLVDDPANNGISVTNRCSSYGGDMIADDQGKLYIISARNNVFKVDPETKVATHLGALDGVPADFTTNGAAVDAYGALLVSSAVNSKALYLIDTKTWKAQAFESQGLYRASDLANSNYLQTREPAQTATVTSAAPTDKFASNIKLYPNPVTAGRIVMQFNKLPAGDYTLQLRDALGRVVQQQKLIISSDSQTQIMSVEDANAKGIYLVKVLDLSSQSVFTQKIMLQ